MANKVLKSLTFPGLNDVYKIPQEADEYSASATYAVGDYCIKDGVLYRCTTAITTAEAWTAGHWTATQLADEVTSQSEKITDVESSFATAEEYQKLNVFVDNKYITTSGATVDITSPTTAVGWIYGVFDCTDGEVFTITGRAGSSPRLWCFIDENGNNLAVNEDGVELANKIIIAPVNSKKIIVNFAKQYDYSIYRGTLVKNLKINDFPVVHGYIDTNGEWGYVGNATTEAVVIPIKQHDGVTVVNSGGVQIYYSFLKSYPSRLVNNTVADFSSIYGYNTVFTGNIAGTRNFVVPSDAYYLVVSSSIVGTDRLPAKIIINGIDVINGNNIVSSLYGGATGAINTLLTKSSKLICTIIDDDALNVLSMQELVNVCEDNNVKCTVASITKQWEEETGLKQQLYDMENSGYQIILHAYNQDENNTWEDIDTRFSDYQENFAKGLRDLHQAGFSNCDFWATPAGIQNANAQKLARKYGMKAMIVSGNGINLIDATNTFDGSTASAIKYWESSRWLIRRATLKYEDEDWTLQDLKDLALKGSEHGAWLVITTHAYQWYADSTRKTAFASRFAEFITYAKYLGYEFMTLGEAWTYREAAYNLYDMR